MTTLRIMGESKMRAVAAPDYVARHSRPSVPKDLHAHNCIRYRSVWDGSVPSWTFSKDGQKTEITVDGTLIINDLSLLLDVTLDGVGVAYVPEPLVASHLASGELVSLLDGWSGVIPGVYLYHPSRRQTPMPLQVFLRFIEKWRKRPKRARRAGPTARRRI